jgi:hypothetical protein
MEEPVWLGGFSIPDLWRPSLLSIVDDDQQQSLFQPLDIDSKRDGTVVTSGTNDTIVLSSQLRSLQFPSIKLAEDVKLPGLDNFQYGQLDLPELPEGSVISTELDSFFSTDDDEVDDIWELVVEPVPVSERPEFITWQNFYGNHVSYKSPYLSEWGASVFDVVSRITSKKSHPIMQSDRVFRSLYHLGLGRSSLLYDYSSASRKFAKKEPKFMISGLSQDATRSLESELLACGEAFRQLADFSDRKYAKSTSSAHIAIANCIKTATLVLEAYISRNLPSIKSWIQLEHAFSRVQPLLQQLQNLAEESKRAKSDEELISNLYQKLQYVEHDATWLRSILFGVFVRVSTPFLERLNFWLGLQPNPVFQLRREKLNITFIQPLIDDETIDFVYDKKAIPSFISASQGQLIYEIGRGLHLLQQLRPENALFSNHTPHKKPLTWISTWPEVESIIQKAEDYEQALSSAVRSYNTSFPPSGEQYPISTISPESHEWLSDFDDDSFAKSISELNNAPQQSKHLPDELYQLINDALEDHGRQEDQQLDIVPPISLLPQLSFDSILQTQARLTKGACLRLLFRSNIRQHLKLQKAFHLMGNGVFVSRISAALFDTNVETTERQLGVMRSGDGMGLRLSERQSWPPASSELRLALMGILSSCYEASPDLIIPKSSNITMDNEVPGGMSFSVRNLPEEEIEKILNPNSIYALDFLRLQYSPSSPITEVITSSSIEKYDSIFKFLLRLMRMLFTVSRFPRRHVSPAIQLFHFQARSFVNSCAAYFFDHVIGVAWRKFEAHVDALERAVREEDAQDPKTMRDLGGIEERRGAHEACLEEMEFGLFLRQRHHKVAGLLEELFAVILALDDVSQKGQAADVAEARALHNSFDEKVRLFVEVCQSLSEKKIPGLGGDESPLSGFSLILDLNGFYERSGRGF